MAVQMQSEWDYRREVHPARDSQENVVWNVYSRRVNGKRSKVDGSRNVFEA